MERIFILGFNGTDIDEARFLCREFIPAGWILFSRNIVDEVQLKELNEALRSICGNFPIFISVDQEGGRVNRLPKKYPSPRTLADLYSKDIEKFNRILQNMINDLVGLGFNLNFAPVLDVELTESEIVGDRAFGDNPAFVAEIGAIWIELFKKGGIESCGKHFPGHGGVGEDSHLTLPIDEVDGEDWSKMYLPPFQINFDKLNFIMLAHIIFKFLDGHLPASLSPATEKLLRNLGYRGFIVSDDLLMKAVKNNFSSSDIAKLLLTNHTDLWIVSRDYIFMEELKKEIINKSWHSDIRDWLDFRLKKLEKFWSNKLNG